MDTPLQILLLLTVAACSANQSDEAITEDIVISSSYKLCTQAPGASLRSKAGGIDYENGQIVGSQRDNVFYYVGMHPSQEASKTHSSQDDALSHGAVKALSEVYSDGQAALVLKGFPDKFSHAPRITVKYTFTNDSESSKKLARILAAATHECGKR